MCIECSVTVILLAHRVRNRKTCLLFLFFSLPRSFFLFFLISFCCFHTQTPRFHGKFIYTRTWLSIFQPGSVFDVFHVALGYRVSSVVVRYAFLNGELSIARLTLCFIIFPRNFVRCSYFVVRDDFRRFYRVAQGE